MRSLNAFRLASALGLSLALALAAFQVAPPTPTPTPVQSATPTDAKSLLALFAKMEGLEARFEEEKRIALLAAPLVSSGRLYFLRPGYLARLVEKPEVTKLLITPDELLVSGKEGEQKIDLRTTEDIRIFVQSLVQVFSGDEAALKESYGLAFERSAGSGIGVDDVESWMFTLTPQRAPLTKLMKELRLNGSGCMVRTFEVKETNGDRTITRILEADTLRHFSDEEKATLFGITRR